MNLIAIIRQTVSGVQAAPDRSGVEAALRLKKQYSGAGRAAGRADSSSRSDAGSGSGPISVTAVCCGDDNALPLLREAIAMGCDDAFLIRTDKADFHDGSAAKAIRSSDPALSAFLLAEALKQRQFGAILTGCYAVDADAIQVGFLLAERLRLPEAGYAEEISYSDGHTFLVKRQFEDRTQLLELPSPCLISALPQPGKRIYPTAEGVTRAYSMKIPEFTAGELLHGTPVHLPAVRLLRSQAKKERKRGNVLTCPTEEAVSAILDTIIKHHIL